MEVEKQIREIIEFYCGGTYENRDAATKKILQICQSLQLQQTGVMPSVLLSENELINLGFEIVRWQEPNYYLGVDRFYKLDYAIMRINKKSGIADDLVIRFREGKFVLENYYSVRFFTVQDIKDLISSLTRISQTEA